MHFTIHADGGSRGNPGPSGAGAIIRDKFGNTVAGVSQFLGVHTNNYAEYEAVILGFEKLQEMISKEKCKEASVSVKMDSELVVKQVNKQYKIKHPVLKGQYARLISIIESFGSVNFSHVPREQNGDADALANEAMDRGSNP